MIFKKDTHKSAENAGYRYQFKAGNLNFEEGVDQLRKKLKNDIVVGSINNTDEQCLKKIIEEFKTHSIPVKNLKLDTEEYRDYFLKAGYQEKYPTYYRDNLYEKTLEHFLCYKLLDLQNGDVFVDIASEHSPVPEIFSRLTGCISYSQDIMYEAGISGRKIGGNVANIPVSDNFFHAAIATCSIEHFENDADTLFIKEMGRTLISGGKVIIVPLYLYTIESCQTDPQYSVPGEVSFDEDATIFCARNWGNRHGRFYSVHSLLERIIKPNPHINFSLYFLENAFDIHSSVYCRFVLEGIKK